jgi:ferredoxin-NADP reductase
MYALDRRAKVLGTQIAGDFTLPRDPREKLVFIAGGIGITPFRSMLKYLLDTKQRRDIVLIYVNKGVGDIIYRDVLSQAEMVLGVRVLYTLTNPTAVPRDWPGAVGRPDERMLLAAVPDYRARTFYLSGPPDMVRAHERVLKRLGIKHSQIKTDFFPGLV